MSAGGLVRDWLELDRVSVGWAIISYASVGFPAMNEIDRAIED